LDWLNYKGGIRMMIYHYPPSVNATQPDSVVVISLGDLPSLWSSTGQLELNCLLPNNRAVTVQRAKLQTASPAPTFSCSNRLRLRRPHQDVEDRSTRHAAAGLCRSTPTCQDQDAWTTWCQAECFFLKLWQELDHIRSRKLELTKSLHVVVFDRSIERIEARGGP